MARKSSTGVLLPVALWLYFLSSEQGAKPVAQDQTGVATAERGTGDTGGIVGHGRDRLLRAKRHGQTPG